MADHQEEQEMEAEALEAIFDDCLEVVSSTQPFEWAISLWPEQHSPEENHVGIKVIAKIPLDYPEMSLPELDIEILKGLTPDHKLELLEMAKVEAEANMGMPAIFTICEHLREWLLENNQKGMDDYSMYAQMIRREKEAEKQTQKAQQIFETQKKANEMSQTESEDMAVRKRRAEGTAVTDESFHIWVTKFEQERQELREKEEAAEGADSKRGSKKEKVVDKSGRVSGFEQFTDKVGSFNLEAMEAACENAQIDEDEEEDLENVDTELFDVEDDDLDDLDFDDEDDDDDDDEDEELDI